MERQIKFRVWDNIVKNIQPDRKKSYCEIPRVTKDIILTALRSYKEDLLGNK